MLIEPLPDTPLPGLKVEDPTTHTIHISSYDVDPPDPPDYFMANPSSDGEDWADYSPVNPSFPTNPYLYDLLVDQLPPSMLPSGASSALTSEAGSTPASESPWTSGANSALASEFSSPLASGANSALTSDSDLPPPSSTKATKQSNLFGFFSKVSSEEPHARWRKRKQDNEDRDREEYAERKQKNDADKLQKLEKKRGNNNAAQRKRRKRIKEEEAALFEEEKGSPVSSLTYPLYCQHILIVLEEVPIPNLNIPTRMEVASASRPRQLVVTALKKREKSRTGQQYKPSKRDSVKSIHINWKSPTYWPLLDQVVREAGPKTSLNDMVKTLQQRDERFSHFTHQRISDYRDKSQTHRVVWSKQTLQEVQKGFLPGGEQTRHNVFVSFLCSVCRSITDGM